MSRAAWLLGRWRSVDEQTEVFKRRHVNKTRITYKAEGDGFQMDAVYNRAFVFTYCVQNQPAPKEYLDMGLLSLHLGLFYLLYTFKDEYHKVNFDSLYSSGFFLFSAYIKHKKN